MCINFINGNAACTRNRSAGVRACETERVYVVSVWEVVLAHRFSQWTLLAAAAARPLVSGTREWTDRAARRRRRRRSLMYIVVVVVSSCVRAGVRCRNANIVYANDK